jgi:Leucine rich repeat
MRFLPIILIALALLASCSEKQNNDRLNPNYPTVKLFLADTVTDQFDMYNCFCNVLDNKIRITNSNGGQMGGTRMVTIVNDADTIITLNSSTDFGEVPEFSIKKHSIILLNSDLKLGDSLTGKILVSGTFTEYKQIGHFEIAGYFKCILKDSNYDFQAFRDDLYEHKDSLRLMKLKKASYTNPDSVTELEFRYSNFHLIENEIARFKKLEKLSLVDFPYVKGELISNLKNLKDLTIEGDKIREVPSSIGQLDKLERLSLTGPITKLPDNIYNLINLKELDLGATNIDKISPRIKDLKNLEILHIGYTRIRQIPKEIFELPKLADLTLPDTVTLFKIKDLNLKSLKKLDAPYELLLYNKSDIGKLRDLEYLTPCFIYETHEESEAKYYPAIKWLEESLPKVLVSSTTYINDQDKELY